MKPLTRNLVSGLQGSDVRELQRELGRLGFDILSQELASGAELPAHGTYHFAKSAVLAHEALPIRYEMIVGSWHA